MASGPLVGIRVIEVASLAPAPFGCMLLADLGAEVLRIDRLNSEAAFSSPPGPLDRGRRTLAVDLKSEDGVAVVRRLATEADVFVEGFRPGVAERLGIGPDELLGVNPRLVYGRMTGWGQTGPMADRAGHDINYISLSGALEPLGRAGEAPHPAINLIGDFAGGGTFLALGILAALLERERSGRGQIVDAAMVDGSNILMAFLHGMRAAGLWNAPRGENLLDGGAPFYDTYETSDGGYMAVGAIEPQFYRELLDKLGLDPDLLGPQMDPASWPESHKAMTAAFRSRSRAEWSAVFDGSDACATPVLSPWEAHQHPHNRARDTYVTVGGMVQPAPAPRFSRTPPATPTAMDAAGRDPYGALMHWNVPEPEAAALVADGIVG